MRAYSSAKSGTPSARSMIAACVSADRTLRSSSDCRSRAVSSAESGGERERDCVELATAPTRAPRKQLGTGRADEQQRHGVEPIGELVDEIEQVVVGPVEILEHEHRRPALGEGLEEPAAGGERLARATVWLSPLGEPDQRAEVRSTQAASVASVTRSATACVSFAAASPAASDSRMPGLCLDDLAERPVRDPLPVGQRAAAPPEDQLGVRVDDLRELVHETALADARDADERDELGSLVAANALERVRQQRQLSRAADERCSAQGDVLDPDPRRAARPPARPSTGSALPFASIGSCSAYSIARSVARYVCSPTRTPPGRRGGLQPRGGVDHVARDHALPRLRSRVERDERLAGVDADPHLELQVRIGVVQLADRVLDRERRADRALGIVLVRDRGPEDSHDRVADELLDRAAEALQVAAEPLVVRSQDRAYVLGIEPLRAGGRADEIGEDDGDRLALLSGRAGHDVESGTARVAEPCVVRVGVAAVSACRHALSLGPGVHSCQALACSSRSARARYAVAPTDS